LQFILAFLRILVRAIRHKNVSVPLNGQCRKCCIFLLPDGAFPVTCQLHVFLCGVLPRLKNTEEVDTSVKGGRRGEMASMESMRGFLFMTAS